MAFFHDLVRLADHDKRLSAMYQAEARYEVCVDTGCGCCVAKRADPNIAVGFETGQVVAGRHSIAPSMKLGHPKRLGVIEDRCKQSKKTSEISCLT